MISLFFVFFLLSEPFVTKIGILQPTMYLITLVFEPVRLTKPFLFITAETLSTPHQVWSKPRQSPQNSKCMLQIFKMDKQFTAKQ